MLTRPGQNYQGRYPSDHDNPDLVRADAARPAESTDRAGLGLLLIAGAVVVIATVPGFPSRWSFGVYLSPVWLLLVGVAIYAALFARMSLHPPVGFRVGEALGRRAFLVPPSLFLHGFTYLLGTGVGLMAVEQALSDRALDGGALPYVGGGIALSVLCLAPVRLFDRPYLALSPDGVIIRRQWRGRIVPWDALAPGGPMTPPSAKVPVVLLMVEGTAGLKTSMWSEGGKAEPGFGWYRLQRNRAFVDQAFLAHAIRYYRENPDARAAIGTPEALEALLPA